MVNDIKMLIKHRDKQQNTENGTHTVFYNLMIIFLLSVVVKGTANDEFT